MSRISGAAREASYYRLWIESDFSRHLFRASDQRRVAILESGTQNLDAGPDFCDALFRIDGHLVRGDVEIHTLATDWYAHHHELDPRYNRVILHVVIQPCPEGFAARKQNGAIVPTLSLDHFIRLSGNSPELFREAPEAELICTLAKQPPDRIRATLEFFGRRRLAMHAAQFQELRSGASWEQLLYYGLLSALGYGKNQIPFRRLALLLPVETINSVLQQENEGTCLSTCEALLFGAAGLLPDAGSLAADEYAVNLLRFWISANQRLHLVPLAPDAWQFFRLRPCNFPTRRLAAAAALVVRVRNVGFLPGVMAMVKRYRKEPEKAALALEELCHVPAAGYWATHCDFAGSVCDAAPRRGFCLLGRARSRDVAVNVFLPLLLAFAEESEDGHLNTAVRALYGAYPALSENEISRLMRRRLDALPGRPAAAFFQRPGGAALQQGMIQLRKTMCRKGSCNACL